MSHVLGHPASLLHLLKSRVKQVEAVGGKTRRDDQPCLKARVGGNRKTRTPRVMLHMSERPLGGEDSPSHVGCAHPVVERTDGFQFNSIEWVSPGTLAASLTSPQQPPTPVWSVFLRPSFQRHSERGGAFAAATAVQHRDEIGTGEARDPIKRVKCMRVEDSCQISHQFGHLSSTYRGGSVNSETAAAISVT